MLDIMKEKDKGPMSDLLTSYSSSLSLDRMAEINKTTFKDAIKFLSRLKNEGKINDDDFSNLVALTCSIFIENELNRRFEKVMGNKTYRLLMG